MCWSPYFVYNLLSVYKVLPPSRGLVAMFMQSLGHMNSVVNPIIYWLFSIRIQRNTRYFMSRVVSMCSAITKYSNFIALYTVFSSFAISVSLSVPLCVASRLG